MSRFNPIVYTGILLVFVVLYGGVSWLAGGLYLDTHEGDSYHFLDILLRMSDGQIPHRDFVTPLGILTFLPITLMMQAGFSVGAATVLAQILVAGLLLHALIENQLRSPLVIAATTIGFGLLLWFADRLGRHARTTTSLSVMDAILIGIAQAVALIPGTSRSGITMTAALALGLTRTDAARFSFLLSIPAILMAGGYETWKLLSDTGPVDWGALLLGMLLAAISAWLCIHFFLRLIERIGMWPFVVYRLLLGAVLLAVFM